MISILLKASFVLALLLLFYKLFLEKESFHSKNRIYLLVCLGLTFGMPFVTLPDLIKEQGVISFVIDQHVKDEVLILNKVSNKIETPYQQYAKNLESTNLKKSSIDESTAPVINSPESILSKADPLEVQSPLVKDEVAAENILHVGQRSTNRSLWYWIGVIYLFGVFVFFLNFLSQIVSVLFKVIKGKDRVEDINCTIINSTTFTEPCSFFNYIFINPESYDYDTYEQILAHEKIHVKKKHTLDLIFSELAVILLWFNPLVWLLRKEIEKNIEYQTDDLLLNGEEVEREVYQMNLLKVASLNRPLSITTNYNQSLIKQRILKINSKKSSFHSLWKYAFVLPLVFGISLLLNKPNAIVAQSSSHDISELSTIDSNENSESESANPDIPNEENIAIDTISTLETDDLLGQEALIISDKQKAPNLKLSILDCDAILSASKARDADKLMNLFLNYPKSCEMELNKDEILQLEIIKGLIECDGDVVIDSDHNIIIRGLDVRVEAQEKHLDYKRAKGIKEVTNPIDYEPLDESIRNMDTEKTIQILRDLNSKHLVFKKKENIETLQYVKYILNNGGSLSIDYTTVYVSNKGGVYIDRENLNQNHNNVTRSDINKPEVKKLINAIYDNDVVLIKQLLETVNVNSIDPNPDKEYNRDGDNSWSFLRANTPLAAAARNSNLEIGKLLVEVAGAEIDFRSRDGETALSSAARAGSFEFVKYLLDKGADINLNSNGYGTALNMASGNGHLEIATYLINQGAELNTATEGSGTALVHAAGNGELETVKLLLSRGADINSMNNGRGSALSSAAGNGELEVVKYLLEHGADINMQNNGQGSALSKAAGNGELKMVKFLLQQGADLNAYTNGQGSALTKAAGNGELEMVKFLIAKGAKVNLKTNSHGSVLNAASRNGEIEVVKYLQNLASSANKSSQVDHLDLYDAAYQGDLDLIKYYLDRGADINSMDEGHGTALHAAARNGEMLTAQFLIKHGANIDAINEGQGSVLNGAAREGHLEMVKYLVEEGADIEAINHGHDSALIMAAREGQFEIVKYLVSQGANVHNHLEGMHTPWQAARQAGHGEIAKFLLEQK